MQKDIDLEEILEKIVFDKDNLNKLKEALQMTKSGDLSIIDLGKKILELRSLILKALVELIPFHLKLTNTNNSIEDFTGKRPNVPRLEQELEERNELLETIGSRINNIYEKLRNKL
jgi:hypothetical protein